MANDQPAPLTGSNQDGPTRNFSAGGISTLPRQLEQFKAALDAHAIVAGTDASGTITYVNDKFCTISQWSREELLGRDHRIINSGHHPKAFFRDLWSTIRSGQVWRGEVKNRAKDGTFYWVDTTIVPFLDANGKPVEYIAIRADITERKRLEEHNATMLQELQETNRELTEFAYVVSHDLKAPLRGISSLAGWLLTDYADKLGDEGRRHLHLIASRVQRLDALVNGILAYSRAGRSREGRLPVDLAALVRNTIELLAPPPHLTLDIATSLPWVVMEPFKAQQLFQNLLSNAIKFMDKPDGRVAISCAREGASWHFSVADNGPGIDPIYFGKIFQLFQTLAPRDKVEGTGVGLALVKKIVESAGGQIRVESSPGAGTTFHFTLPYSTVASTTNMESTT